MGKRGRAAQSSPLGVSVCTLEAVKRGYADARVRWTLHRESFWLLSSFSTEMWMQKKEASFSRVTIFCLTKVVTRFTQLRTKTHRLHAGLMWSDQVTLEQSFRLFRWITSGQWILWFCTSMCKIPRNSLVIRKNYESFKATNKPVRFDL